MSEPGTEWTANETAALVDAYIWMWMNDRSERSFVKAHLVRALMAGPVAGRSRQSIEYKLRNVSKVFADMNLPHVSGYVPADNASEVNDQNGRHWNHRISECMTHNHSSLGKALGSCGTNVILIQNIKEGSA